MNGKVTYRQQFTRCGKERCHKCKEGKGHGPYWYAYWSENGRTVSKYIGTKLPEHIAALQQPGNLPLKEITTYVSSTNTTGPSLRVYLLGQFRIEHNVDGVWRAVDSRTWRRRRARSLLGCLLSSPGRRLGREQVMEQLWPDLEIEVAANRLNGAVHELRQILEPDIDRPANSRLLRLERDILELANSSEIWVDAEAFESLLKEAYTTSDPHKAENLLEEAATLYQGSYLLEELYSEWATPRRDALQRAWVGLLLKLAHIQVEQGAKIRAIDTLDRLRTTDPTNETALQRLMLLLTQMDRRGEALQIYKNYQEMLQREYESEPLPETSQLYASLKQGHIPILTEHTPVASSSTAPVAQSGENVAVGATNEHNEAQGVTRLTFQAARHNQSPLIGRDHELELMRQALSMVEGGKAPPHTGTDTTPLDVAPQLQSATARHSRPRFILLKGEAGIGKTRLAEELSLEADQHAWTVAWSRSYEQEGAIPYRPWTELLRTLLRSMESFQALLPGTGTANSLPNIILDSPLKMERLGVLLPELALHSPDTAPAHPLLQPILHEHERLHLWEATRDLLSIVSNTYPLLLVFDDLHWADDSSIELLIYLSHHLQTQKILFVGTCRDGELAPQHKLRTLVQDLQREQIITTVAIKPLTYSQISTMVSYLPKNVISSIQKQAYGNPFFAEELARYLSSLNVSDALPDTDESETHAQSTTYAAARAAGGQRLTRQAATLPEAIAAVLERRLGKLSSECQLLLGKAAVLGGSFALNQLLPMSNERSEDSVLDLLDEALQAGLLIEEGTGAHITYHFWHPLIINHLYSRLSATRRAQLHRRAAEAIKMTNPKEDLEKVAATIVYHLSRGGGDPNSLAYYAELAGNQAYALAAYTEAQQHYVQALQALIEPDPERNESNDLDEQIGAITQQQILPGSEEQRTVICRLLEYVAECSINLGKFAEARRLYESILSLRMNAYQAKSIIQDELQQQEAQIQALLWREIGNTWLYTGDYTRANECYERGRTEMERAGVTSGAAWACLQIEYGEMARLVGNYQEAHQYLETALEMLERLVEPFYQSGVNRQQGQHSSLQTSVEHSGNERPKTPQTRTERALHGNPLEIGYAHERLGIVAASVGQFNDALSHLRTALNTYEQGGLVSAMARVYSNLGAVYVLRGELQEARVYLHRSLALAERTADLPNMAFVMINLGEVAYHSGDLLEAEKWYQQSLVLSAKINDRERQSWCHTDLAAVQQDLGNMQAAKYHLRQAIIIGRIIKSPRCLHFALVILGRIRIAEAQQYRENPVTSGNGKSDNQQQQARLLGRAKTILSRAVALEEMEIENIIEGKLLLATVHLLTHDAQTALAIAQQALQEAREQEAMRGIGSAYHVLGRILTSNQELDAAGEAFEKAMHIFQQGGWQLDYARALYDYGILVEQQDQEANLGPKAPAETRQAGKERQKSLHYLQEAETIFQQCHAVTDIVRVERRLNGAWQTGIARQSDPHLPQ